MLQQIAIQYETRLGNSQLSLLLGLFRFKVMQILQSSL